MKIWLIGLLAVLAVLLLVLLRRRAQVNYFSKSWLSRFTQAPTVLKLYAHPNYKGENHTIRTSAVKNTWINLHKTLKVSSIMIDISAKANTFLNDHTVVLATESNGGGRHMYITKFGNKQAGLYIESKQVEPRSVSNIVRKFTHQLSDLRRVDYDIHVREINGKNARAIRDPNDDIRSYYIIEGNCKMHHQHGDTYLEGQVSRNDSERTEWCYADQIRS